MIENNINIFVTFIVATYNCESYARDFCSHIEKFSFEGCEFLISDGGSTDNTINIISKCLKLKIVNNSKDKGIYDAWNIALPFARGRYISFVGIDDIINCAFYHKAYHACLHNNYGLIYGDAIKKFKKYREHAFYNSKSNFFEKNGYEMDFPHPGCLNHRDLFKENNFSSDYKLAGDLEFYFNTRERIKKMRILKIDCIQAEISTEGLSNNPKAFFIYYKEFKIIEKKLNIKFPSNLLIKYIFNMIWIVAPGLHAMCRGVKWRFFRNNIS